MSRYQPYYTPNQHTHHLQYQLYHTPNPHTCQYQPYATNQHTHRLQYQPYHTTNPHTCQYQPYTMNQHTHHLQYQPSYTTNPHTCQYQPYHTTNPHTHHQQYQPYHTTNPHTHHQQYQPYHTTNQYNNINLNAVVNNFYQEKVQLAKDDAKKHTDIALPNVDKILKYINEEDPRFGPTPLRAGSYWQGLKTEKADEYDFSIIIEGLGTYCWGDPNLQMPTSRYYTFLKNVEEHKETLESDQKVISTPIPLPAPPSGHAFVPADPIGLEWHNKDDLLMTCGPHDTKKDIVPILVKKRLKELLSMAIRNLELHGQVHQSRKVRGSALTFSFKARTREIDIDFAPIIRAGLPFPDWLGWPRPESNMWPGSEKVDRIKDKGMNMVAKTDFYWMYCFAEVEKELVAGVDIDGGKRKELHRVMKKLNADNWSKTNKPVISSYALKNIWFWEMEKYLLASDWDNDHVWIRLESMTRELLSCIRKRYLSQYFFPSFNLLAKKIEKYSDELDSAATNIERFLADPLKYLSID